MIDFSPTINGNKTLIEIWQDENMTVRHLRDATNKSVDFLLNLIADLDDDDVVFVPVDPDVKPSLEGDITIGWTIAHLIAHVTASSEEGAALSSILARGVPDVEQRLHYEMPWQKIRSKGQCIERLQESRRIRLAYLEAWPEEPHYDNYQVGIPESVRQQIGEINAPAAFMAQLAHEISHYEQFKEVKRQALETKGTK